MPAVRPITPSFAVAGELTAADIADLARLGFRGLISNRPDGEERGQLTAAETADLAAAAGLAFRHVPASKHDLFSAGTVAAMQAAVADLEGPVLAHCKSGLRSAVLWAIVAAGEQPIGEVVATVRAAGFDISGLADDIVDAGRAPLAAAGTTGRAV